MAAMVIAGGFSLAVHSLSSHTNHPRDPMNLRFYVQSFKPIPGFRKNPSLVLPRLRIAPLTAAPPKRAYCASPASLSTSASLDSNHESQPEEESGDSNEVASVEMKLPRRSLQVEFTCNSCGERTKRLINRLAYERGLVFVQCSGCHQYHKLADNLGLVIEYDFREKASESSTDQV